MFCVLNKKMILLKKINIEHYFLVGLSAVYLLKSELHLKYEKITIINNMQLLHKCRYSYRTRTPTCICYDMGIKSLLEIYMKFLSLSKFLINKFPWKCKSLQPLFHFKEKISVLNFENKKNSMWQDWEPIQGRRIHSS